MSTNDLERSMRSAMAAAAAERGEPSVDELELRPLTTTAELRDCVELQQAVWGGDFSELVPTSLLRVAQQVGGVAAGAFTPSGRLAGFVFGISGIRDGQLAHWSDTLAVREEYRNRGLGERLKRHQRDLLLAIGIGRMFWTFDPLESKNAYLNLARLGGTAREYHRDYYGETASRLHAGIGTDRLIVFWDLASDRVRRRLAGERFAPSAAELRKIPVINMPRETGLVVEPGEPELAHDAPRVCLTIPADIQRLKSAVPAVAAEWRRVTRRAFESYFARGYVASELIRDGATSSYILERAR